MTGAEYAFVMSALAVLAVIVKLLTFDVQGWIRKDLKRGDLYALVDVASGVRPNGLSPEQAHRLQARGMVRSYGNGNYGATLKGRLALLVREAVGHTVQVER
ncbi:MAG TPA: hypothetical protein VL048_13260 [Xanthobacteraceae bacterium]|jgi:hypothetical protein|nr:hypothetical protein [Xanthobacteraceae bacterium]